MLLAYKAFILELLFYYAEIIERRPCLSANRNGVSVPEAVREILTRNYLSYAR